MRRARLSCPWCLWLGEANAETIEDVTVLGQRMVEEHAVRAGHRVKAGRKPRVGYYRGEPVQ